MNGDSVIVSISLSGEIREIVYQIIRINLLEVSLSNHFQLCSDFKSAECLASIPIHESCDIGVKEVLPSLCSLFHNRKCQFVISENKDERRLPQIVGQPPNSFIF